MVSEELIEKFTAMKSSYIMAINLLEQVQLKIERLSSEVFELRDKLSSSWGFEDRNNKTEKHMRKYHPEE